MQYNSKYVGLTIKEFRKSKGISQEVLSSLAGISRSHFSMIENGKKKALFETFWNISEALGLPPHALVREIESRIRNDEQTRS